MADQLTTVTKTGYFKRIMNSVGGIIIGVILFFASFVVLFNNEGSVDYSTIAKTAVEVDSATVTTDPALADKLLVTSGTFASEETIGDDLFLKPGSYLALQREVEMYAWVEETDTDTSTDVGGSETTTTTYTYVKTWTSGPKESSSFKEPTGHTNPPLEMKEESRRVRTATVGAYKVDMQSIMLPSLSAITLNTENTEMKDGAVLDKSGYIYISKTPGSTYSTPTIGDVRVSYKVLRSGDNATVFGKLNGDTFGTFLTKDNLRFYQAFSGSKEEAIASLHEAYVTWLWVWRLVGFLMMWIGLSTILAPLSVMTDLLPFAGAVSRSIVGAVTFVIALVLSAVTILISMLLHNVVALVITLLVVIGGAYFFLNMKKGAASGLKKTPYEPPAGPTTSSGSGAGPGGQTPEGPGK